MKALLLAALAFVLVAPLVSAQGRRPASPKPRLRIAVGVSSRIDTRVHVDATVELMGREMQTIVDASGVATLDVTAVDRDDVTWRYGIPELAITATAPFVSREGTQVDTTVSVGPFLIVTDRKGVVRSMNTPTPDATSITGLLDMALQGQWADVLFSPMIARGATPGERWTVDVDDSSITPDGTSGAPVSWRRTYARTFTYDGLVDTLGRATMRVRSRVDSMRIAGTAASIAIEGGGAQSSTAWYDAVTGILVAATIDSESELIANQGSMVVPMNVRARYVAVGRE